MRLNEDKFYCIMRNELKVKKNNIITKHKFTNDVDFNKF